MGMSIDEATEMLKKLRLQEMGRLIELSDQDYQYCLDYANGKTNIFALNNASRIIKAVANSTRYENRLKADMVAMLKELEKELKEVKCNYLATIYDDIAEEYFNLAKVKGLCLIQQKINELKEQTDESM